MPPFLSVLLPVRNGAETLPRAIESCLHQSWSDFELIIVNDGSTDTTQQVIESFCQRDERIVAIELGSNRGLVPALQAAHEAARGYFIARMDADDYSYPIRFEEQLRYLHRNGGVGACGTRVQIVGSVFNRNDQPRDGFQRYMDWINNMTDPAEIAAGRFIESPLVHPSVMMRCDALNAVGGYQDSPWAEDYDLWLRMLDRGFKLGKVSSILLDWYDGANRLTRTDERYSLDNFMRAKVHYLARIPEVRRRGVMISGAGETGKRFARELKATDVQVHAFLDVHPQRIGKKIHGIPVFEAEFCPEPSSMTPVQLAAVGRPESRPRLCDFFLSRGFKQGHDFFCVA